MPKLAVNKSKSTLNVNTGSQGFRVTDEKYDLIRKAILAGVPASAQGITFAELVARTKKAVGSRRDLFPKAGSVMWYTKVVQLDLEKRGLIKRLPETVPQRLRRAKV